MDMYTKIISYTYIKALYVYKIFSSEYYYVDEISICSFLLYLGKQTNHVS